MELLRNEVLNYAKSGFQLDQKEQLKSIYLDCFSMVNLKGQKVALISDTHLASKYENLEYFLRVLDFCHRENIYYLFHGGDIGDGLVEPDCNYRTPMQQLQHIIDVYPSDKYVKQYILGGNHDYKYFRLGFDLIKLLSSEKNNIYPLGYFQAFFTIFDYPFFFEHYCKMRPQYDLNFSSFVISGHAHKSRFGDYFIKIPTLSNNIMYGKSSSVGKPGFIVMETYPNVDSFDLKFMRYSFSGSDLFLSESHSYQFTKKMTFL